MNILFISHTDPSRLHPPWSLSHAFNKKYFLCFMDLLHCHFLANQNLPLWQEESFAISLQPAPKRVGYVGNHIWEQFGNLMGTWSEHIGSKGKKQKIPFPPCPLPPSKRKKKDHSHWLRGISLSKNVHHQFFAWATVMPILKNWGYLFCQFY